MTLLKYVDDTTVTGQIKDNEESIYRQEVELLAYWCSHNHLELNLLKTVLLVDFRRRTPPSAPREV